jgi:toxin ParE1/3/4
MERVADDPERGQVRDDLRQRYRSYRIGRLVVFFVVRAYGVDIVRVLHQRMDPLRHLGGREPGLCVEIVAALGR